MMETTYTALAAWADARSPLTFVKEDLQAGRLQAIKVWNDCITDAYSNGAYQPIIDLTEFQSGSGNPTAPAYVEEAAYAFAMLNMALRIDGEKMDIQGSGIAGNPAAVAPQLSSMAHQAVAAYSKWVAEVKPRQAAAWLGV